MSADLRSWAGLARSLAIYRARPWTIPRLAGLYATFLRPGDLAFDIGAHVGNRTRAMLRTGARVVAVEPQRACHAFLARDLPAGVTLLHQAVGPTTGRAELAVSRLHPTVSSLAPGFAERMATTPGFTAVRWDAVETVETVTLDGLIGAFGLPRFVKIDVEGFEAEVLAGLSRPVSWLAFEYLPAMLETADACVARLAQLGPYAFNVVRGEAGAFALEAWVGPGTIGGVLRDMAGDRRPGDVYARWLDADA